MANQGKRMVKENLIVQISQKQDELTAGTGIDITNDTISIDDTVALKSEIITSYNDLTDKPDLSIYAESANLATVATTGAYSDLTGTPTIPDAVSGTNDGTNWTTLTIGEDTYDIPQGGGSGTNDYNDLTNVPIINIEDAITVGPNLADQDVIDAWIKSLPVFVGRGSNNVTTLTNAGFTNIIEAVQGQPYVVQGYFALVREAGSSPYGITNVVVFTTENRTGTNTLINRSCTNKVTITKVANQDYGIAGVRYRGVNTSLSSFVDPISETDPIEVYSVAAVQGYELTATCNNTKNVISHMRFGFDVANPEATTYQDQLIPPTTDGTYTLKVTVTSGVPTFS